MFFRHRKIAQAIDGFRPASSVSGQKSFSLHPCEYCREKHHNAESEKAEHHSFGSSGGNNLPSPASITSIVIAGSAPKAFLISSTAEITVAISSRCCKRKRSNAPTVITAPPVLSCMRQFPV